MFKKALPFSRFSSLVLFGLGVMLGAGLFSFPAFAGTSDLNGETATVTPHLLIVARLIAFISYVVGTAFATRALFALKGFIEKPDDNPITRFIGFATVSALLIMLPYSIGVTQNTLKLQTAGVLSSSQSFATADACPDNKSLNVVFCRLASQMMPFAKFLSIASYIMAASLTLTGLLNLKAYGDDPSQIPLRSIITKFVIATMFISLPFAMQIFITSVTGVSSIEAKTDAPKKPKLFSGSL